MQSVSNKKEMFKVTLRQKTDKALGVLSAVLGQLASIAQEAAAQWDRNLEEINKLQAENADICELLEENSVVQNNIKNLLGK